MAFVPRIHNRQQPTANQAVFVRSSLDAQRKHRLALQNMKPAIDNKWGGIRNGVRETKLATYTHVVTNPKRAQLEDEKAQAIELENFHLLEKLSRILERPQNPNAKSREWGGGVRLDPHQVPLMDHVTPAKTTMFGAAIEGGSLNIGMRERQQNDIVVANHKLVKRIQMCKPTYDRKKMMVEDKNRQQWLYNQAVANRPLEYAAPPRRPMRSRPASAGAALTAPPGLSSAFGGRARPESAGGARLTTEVKPLRPSTARPQKPKRRESEVDRRAQADASVLRVLDLLSAQRSKISSLRELRQQKDQLMTGVFTPASDITTELIEANGVVIHVTSSSRCTSTHGSSFPDQIVLLVHGGLFMSGSYHASAHLAAKLCDMLDVAVATPKMRLAPEHPFPAAYDDLKAAYTYLTQYGIDPHRASPPPQKIALYAESSGGALALSMLQTLQAEASETEPPALPCCVSLSSPWLDLTCDGGSYVVNEAYDLMMRKDRLIGIATAYLGGAVEPTDARASPLLAPEDGITYKLPPTLVHVCKNELLLDDSLILGEYARNAGTDITVKSFDQVMRHTLHTPPSLLPCAISLMLTHSLLRSSPFTQALHGWHTYFPLMPIAMQALSEMADFMRMHLFPEGKE